MAKISLRYRASRTGLYSAAPGMTDVIADQLGLVAGMIDEQLPDDAYASSIKPAAQQAASSVERGRAFVFEVTDTVASQQSALSGFIAGRKRAADQEIAPSGWGRVADREVAVAARARQIETEILTSTAKDVVSKGDIQLRAADIAQSAVENLEQLERAVTACSDDWNGPSTLRVGADESLETIMRRSNLGRELSAMHPSKVFDLFTGAVERGQNDRAREIADVYGTELPALRVEVPAKLLIKFGAQDKKQADFRVRTDGGAADLRTWFDRISDAFRSFREQTTPQSIVMGAAVANALRALFAEIFGISPRTMDGGKFAREFLNTDNALKRMARDPLTVADDWLWRRLPGVPGAILPSGWSPIVRTQNGVAYRKVG